MVIHADRPARNARNRYRVGQEDRISMPNEPISRRTLFVMLAGMALTARAADAAPIRYRLDTAASIVGFRYYLNGAEQRGSMPVQRADIVIDPEDLAGSRVDVSLRAAGARTGLFLGTQALTGRSVLDAARFPLIRFVSDRVRLAPDGRLSGGASIEGRLTVRDITLPVTLRADLYRARGSAPDDLSVLTVQLSGRLSRSAFGASGYPNLVDDMVEIDITAVIRAE